MKKLGLALLLSVSSVFLWGCALSMTGMFHTPKTPEEQAWLENVMNEPFEFEMKGEEEKVAWSRAQSWISQYSGVPIKVISEYVIETEVPGQGNMGYKVTKTQNPDGNIRIKVGSVVESGGALSAMLLGEAKDSTVNLHILTHFIRTGDLPYPHLIRTVAAPGRPKSQP